MPGPRLDGTTQILQKSFYKIFKEYCWVCALVFSFLLYVWSMHKSLCLSCTVVCHIHQKPTKGGVGFAWKNCWVPPPLVTTLTSKCHNFFSIESLSSLEMYVRQKFSLCLFSQNKFDFVCFPLFLPCFWPKNAFFGLKSRILMGNRQTKTFKKKKNFKCFRCFFIPWLYQKLQIWKSYDCSNTRLWWKKWGIFLIFPKKTVIYTKLLLFLEK